MLGGRKKIALKKMYFNMDTPKDNELVTKEVLIVDWKKGKGGSSAHGPWQMYHYVTEGGSKITGFEDSHPKCFNAFEAKEKVKLSMRYSEKYKNWSIVNAATDKAKQRSKEFTEEWAVVYEGVRGELNRLLEGERIINGRIQALEDIVLSKR